MTTLPQALDAVDTLIDQLQAYTANPRYLPRYFDTFFGLRTALGSARDRFAATHGTTGGDRPAFATILDRSEQAHRIGTAIAPDDAIVSRYASAVQRAIATLEEPAAGAARDDAMVATARPAVRGTLRLRGAARRTAWAGTQPPPIAEPYYASLVKLFPVEAVTLYPLAIGIAAGYPAIRLILIAVIILFIVALRWFATQDDAGGDADMPAIAVSVVSFVLYAAALGGFGFLPGGAEQTGQFFAFITIMWVALIPVALRRARR